MIWAVIGLVAWLAAGLLVLVAAWRLAKRRPQRQHEYVEAGIARLEQEANQ